MSGSSNLLLHFREFAGKHRFFPENGKIVVAVSGGIDSVVLLHVLASVHKELGLSLMVAHVNHLLREADADRDEQFVARLAEAGTLPCRVLRRDVGAYARQKGIGIEEAGREVRYQFLEEVRREHRFDVVATAHTADDNAETVLFHLVRGSGVRGLAGIPLMRNDRHLVRPLLFATRQEIEEYAREQNIQFCSDASNASTEWTRNYLRHSILPLLKERLNPDLVHTLQRTSDIFRELDAYLADVARTACDLVVGRSSDRGVSLSIPHLTMHPEAIRQYIVKQALDECLQGGVSWSQARSVLDLLGNQVGSWVSLPDGCRACRERDALVVKAGALRESFAVIVQPGERCVCREFAFSSEFVDAPGHDRLGREQGIEYVDADRVGSADLVFRSWRTGDAFVPLGMTGKKKLSDFFVDEQMTGDRKQEHPVLETAAGDIVWVCGLRIDDRFKIRPTTTRTLRLMFSRTTE